MDTLAIRIDAFFFMIKYEKDSAIEICVHRALRDGNHAIVTLGEWMLFVHQQNS